MGGSVAMGTDCERRSTTASEEASPKTASRIAERDILFVAIAEIRRDEKADSLRPRLRPFTHVLLRTWVQSCLPVTDGFT